ncbi:MAG: hypothetical protein ACT4RN_06645 [Pseudonocardia sp.]
MTGSATRSAHTVAATLAAADVAEALRALPRLRHAVTVAQRAAPAHDRCPCRTCVERAERRPR